MNQIITGQVGEPQITHDICDSMFRLRNEIFHKRLGWDVNSRDGREQDEYDAIKPFYMLSTSDTGQVNGCWRLLPTTGPYMLKDTFPCLLHGEDAPQDPHVWEISRFAIAPESATDRRQAHFSEITFNMMRSVVRFAYSRNIHSYVFVTSVALERMFQAIDIDIERLGNGRAQRFGKVMTVACRIHINTQTHQAVFDSDHKTTYNRELA